MLLDTTLLASIKRALTASTLILLTTTLLIDPSALMAQTPPISIQIAGALQAAPEVDRENATVLGFGEDGAMTMLREGQGQLICLADDPNQDGWSVACAGEEGKIGE